MGAPLLLPEGREARAERAIPWWRDWAWEGQTSSYRSTSQAQTTQHKSLVQTSLRFDLSQGRASVERYLSHRSTSRARQIGQCLGLVLELTKWERLDANICDADTVGT
jgi:hypothetical protein